LGTKIEYTTTGIVYILNVRNADGKRRAGRSTRRICTDATGLNQQA